MRKRGVFPLTDQSNMRRIWSASVEESAWAEGLFAFLRRPAFFFGSLADVCGAVNPWSVVCSDFLGLPPRFFGSLTVLAGMLAVSCSATDVFRVLRTAFFGVSTGCAMAGDDSGKLSGCVGTLLWTIGITKRGVSGFASSQ